MKRIKESDAVKMFYSALDKESIQDRLSELIHDIFLDCVNNVENHGIVVTNSNEEFSSDEAWYDEIEDDFNYVMWSKIRAFVTTSIK